MVRMAFTEATKMKAGSGVMGALSAGLLGIAGINQEVGVPLWLVLFLGLAPTGDLIHYLSAQIRTQTKKVKENGKR